MVPALLAIIAAVLLFGRESVLQFGSVLLWGTVVIGALWVVLILLRQLTRGMMQLANSIRKMPRRAFLWIRLELQDISDRRKAREPFLFKVAAGLALLSIVLIVGVFATFSIIEITEESQYLCNFMLQKLLAFALLFILIWLLLRGFALLNFRFRHNMEIGEAEYRLGRIADRHKATQSQPINGSASDMGRSG